MTAGNMAGNLTSDAEPLDSYYGSAIQAVYTGSPVGTLKLQASIDGTNYSDITASSQSITASGSFLWNITANFYRYVRVVWTATSGSGTLVCTILAKGY